MKNEILNMSKFRLKKEKSLSQNSYERYLEVLTVNDLFNEANLTINEIDFHPTIDLFKKAQSILHEISARIGTNPSMFETVSNFKSNIKEKIDSLNLD